jgi:hypothetical protein
MLGMPRFRHGCMQPTGESTRTSLIYPVSSAYSTSSSNEDEGDRRKSKKSSKNLSGLSCFARDGFCTMALSSGSKKSTQSYSDSDSDDEVRDELPFLR